MAKNKDEGFTAKAYSSWLQSKAWCYTHPNQKYAIVNPYGRYEIIYIPNDKGEK